MNLARFFRPSAVVGVIFLLAAFLAHAQKPLKATTAEEASLRSFLATYLSNKSSPPDKTTRHSESFIDLNGDGQPEIVVYISGDSWCGSGGCNMYILSTQKSAYKIVGRTSITHLPIRVLPTKTHGWHDLSVSIAGGGILHGYDAKLSFDGNRYPSNPTMPPASHLPPNAIGIDLIPASENGRGKPLYP